MDMISTLLFIVFVLAAIVLIVVVLLQEGKGGGLGSALGEGGQQTVGVGAKGINQFTGVIALLFLGSAVMLHVIKRQDSSTSVISSPSVLGDGIPGDPASFDSGDSGVPAPPKGK